MVLYFSKLSPGPHSYYGRHNYSKHWIKPWEAGLYLYLSSSCFSVGICLKSCWFFGCFPISSEMVSTYQTCLHIRCSRTPSPKLFDGVEIQKRMKILQKYRATGNFWGYFIRKVVKFRMINQMKEKTNRFFLLFRDKSLPHLQQDSLDCGVRGISWQGREDIARHVARPEEDLGWIMEWQNQGPTLKPRKPSRFWQNLCFLLCCRKLCSFVHGFLNQLQLCILLMSF